MKGVDSIRNFGNEVEILIDLSEKLVETVSPNSINNKCDNKFAEVG